MSTSRDKQDTPSAPPRMTVILLLGDIADTTWRMFVPTLGLAGLGLWVDKTWHTGPLWSLSGVALGVLLAALLVRAQFAKVKRETNDK